MTEAELADHYNEAEDISEFYVENPEPVTIRRDATISVRFSADEIANSAPVQTKPESKSPLTSE